HGPIMGIDYSGIIHKWSWWHNATSSGNRTLQDDIAVIAGRLNAYDGSSGDGYRPDDHGGTLASATALPYFGATQSIMGIVERMEDVDMFSFQSTGGRYSIVAGRDAPSGVDVKLSIYDAAGEMIAYE